MQSCVMQNIENAPQGGKVIVIKDMGVVEEESNEESYLKEPSLIFAAGIVLYVCCIWFTIAFNEMHYSPR